jgi:hypothetical protein
MERETELNCEPRCLIASCSDLVVVYLTLCSLLDTALARLIDRPTVRVFRSFNMLI